MNTLKELSNIYLSDLSEGLLDDIEDNLTAGSDYMDNEMFSKWAVSDKSSIVKKKNGYVLKGNFKITGIDTYNGPKIKEVIGNLAISKTGLTNLEGLFNVDTEIKGSLTIEDNDKLISLSGCPLIVTGSLTITGNKSLKDIDYSPTVYINAYVSKNGKKFKKDDLSKKMQVYKHIFCAMDDEFVIESESINEAFKAPELTRIADSIKKASDGSKDRNQRVTMRDISTSVPWDKLDSSNITEISTDDNECYKMIRRLTSNKIANGIMAMVDEEGDVYAIASGFWGKTIGVLQLKTRWGDVGDVPYWDRQRNKLDRWSGKLELRPTELIDYVSGKGWGHPKFDSVMFVVWGKDETRMNANLQVARDASKRNALAFQRGRERSNDSLTPKYIRYYQSIAEENRERYKKLVIQIKAQKALLTNSFMTLKARLDSAFNRYTNLLVKVLQNPSKYDSYDINWLNDKFHAAHKRDKYTTVETGLFRQLEVYMVYVIDASKGSTGYNTRDVQQTIQDCEARISRSLDEVEKELTKLESK
jgi:hypothetical protein